MKSFIFRRKATLECLKIYRQHPKESFVRVMPRGMGIDNIRERYQTAFAFNRPELQDFQGANRNIWKLYIQSISKQNDAETES